MSEEKAKYIKFKCEYCDKEFSSSECLHNHYHNSHSDIADFEKIKHDWVCEYCGEKFSSRRKLKIHQKDSCEEKQKFPKNIVGRAVKNAKDKKYCKLCGNLLNDNRKSFCNFSCAAKYNNQKRKENGKNYKGIVKQSKCLICGKDIVVSVHTSKDRLLCYECKCKINPNYRGAIHKKKCEHCGKEFLTSKLNVRFCSPKCSNNDIAVKEKKSKAMKRLMKSGKLKGWNRTKQSYPEIYWTNVLDKNNIQYEREFYIKEFGYFLDFFIKIGDNKIDLEIDGKQHLYKENVEKDSIRDRRLTSLNYIIYRIPWNEIKTDNGKDMMKDKINNFLTFINTFKG